MAKRKETDFSYLILMLFVFLAPILGSGFEKNAVVYASLCAFFVALGYGWYKRGTAVLTKTFFVLTAIALCSFLQIIWVSDKGSQFAFGAIFLLGAVASLVAADWKAYIGKDRFSAVMLQTVYSAALLYAMMALLHQIFIESSFIGCDMDFGGGSSTVAAVIMLWGIMSAVHLFKNKKKHVTFIVALLLMVYVFVMSKSLIGYLLGALIALVYTLGSSKKRIEALPALIGVVVLGVINIASIIATILTDRGIFDGALRGIVSVFGLGNGGYNAAVAVVDKGRAGFSSTANLFMEAFGALGIVIIAVIIFSAAKSYMKKRSLMAMVVLLSELAVMLSSSAALVFMIPLFAMYHATDEDGVRIKAGGLLSLAVVVPAAFFALLAGAYVPYAMGSHACDMGRYEDGEAYYRIGASMEIFNSKGWEMAYEASYKAFEVNGANTMANQREYLEKAISFNNKNYKYRRLLAEAFTNEGDYISALETWESIILRHDKEYLYPMYAQKIYDVMANCPVGLERMEKLYRTLTLYGQKANDKDIKFEVNNILSRSQQYYIASREGSEAVADMYAFAQ